MSEGVMLQQFQLTIVNIVVLCLCSIFVDLVLSVLVRFIAIVVYMGKVLDCLIMKFSINVRGLFISLSIVFSFFLGGGGGGGGIILLSLFFHLFLASICFVLNLYYLSCLFHVH